MTREQDLIRAVGFPEGPRWYVVQSRPRKELYTAMNLQNRVGHVQRLQPRRRQAIWGMLAETTKGEADETGIFVL